MAQSPLSRLSKEEYAARQRLLRLILVFMGVLLVGLLGVQIYAALPKTAEAIGEAVAQTRGVTDGLSGETAAIQEGGSGVIDLGSQARDGWIMLLIKETVLHQVAASIDQAQAPPVEERPVGEQAEEEIITEEPVLTDTSSVEEQATQAMQ
ncbi:TPA: hypothetical protein DEB00_01210 [Candidatus Uhrbacteria bacterium]|nr:hypothetical protein [Candidatus Uhrbacteria bacterium]